MTGRKTVGNLNLSMLTFIGCLLCGLIRVFAAEAATDAIRIDGSKISVNIEDMGLKEVFEAINKQRKFRVQGDSDLLDRKISIRFQNLTFQEGLRRILNQANYVLMFDGKYQPSGVILMDGGKPMDARDAGGTVALPDLPEPADEEIGGMENMENPIGEAEGLFENPDLPITNDQPDIALPPGDDTPLPSGPVEISEQEAVKFMIEENVAPPGGPVAPTPEELDLMKQSGGPEAVPHPEIENLPERAE